MCFGSYVKLTLMFCVVAAPAWAGPRAEFVGRYIWTETTENFGGFSALDLGPDGQSFVAVSDTASFFSGRFRRGRDGAVIAVQAAPPVTPPSHHGTPIHAPMDDAEGVAIGPGGQLFVSFETEDRIGVYGQGGRVWITELWPEAFRDFEVNGGAEALAIAADGALYTMPERAVKQGGLIPVLRYHDGVWDQPFTLRRDGDWAPVGADFGPDGRLYILERDFWGLIGFMSRVRRITIVDDAVSADEVLLQTRAGRHDNLEGLATWLDADGRVRLTMISDDNFMPFQRTEIVDYRILE